MTKKITVPDIGTTGEAAVIEIFVKAGDKIDVDTPLITLESDKASMEIPSSEAGIIESIAVKLGDKLKTGGVILILQEQEKKENKNSETPEKSEKLEEIKMSDIQKKSDEIYTSPMVRRLARELNIDLSNMTGTGKKNRIQKEDLLGYINHQLQSSTSSTSGLPLAPVIDFSQFGETDSQPLSKIKKLTAINLHRNWVLIPHVTQFNEADITELEAFRKSQSEKNLKLTPLVFIMKAVVAALKKFPVFNASLDASGQHLIFKKYFHLGIAVDTPEGLVVPVIRHVDQKSLSELAKELGEISQKARDKKLLPKDMQGSCFTISSLGGIGGTGFTPIVNLPDVAILGVSKSQIKPVYENNQFIPRLMLPLSLSYDHRVIDGAEGARFIVALSQYLADIKLLLV